MNNVLRNKSKMTFIVVAACAFWLRYNMSSATEPTTFVGYTPIEAANKFVKEPGESELAPEQFELLPKTVWSQVWNRLCFVIRADARAVNPSGRLIEGKELQIRVFAATDKTPNDLVELRWKHEDQMLRALVSSNAIRLEFSLDELQRRIRSSATRPNMVEAVKPFVESILALNGETTEFRPVRYAVEIPWPTDLREGVMFSTNHQKQLGGMSFERWFERIDGFVEGRTLTILTYWKPGQIMNFQDGSKWFPDDFRKMIQEKQRAQEIRQQNP